MRDEAKVVTVLKVNKSVYTPLHYSLLSTLLKYIDDQLKIIVEDDKEWRENWMAKWYRTLLLLVI